MEMLSDAYGWTPQQIRDMAEEEVEDYIRILNVKEQLRKVYNKK